MELEELLSMLEITGMDSLHPHEQTIPANLRRLQEAMFNLGRLVDPLVIDRKTGVILDGNHRYLVLRNMEIPNAVVQPVDYFSDKIGLGTWLPASKILMRKEDFEKLGEKTESVDFEAGKRAIDSLEAVFMIVSGKGGDRECALISPGSYDVVSMTAKQKELISSLSQFNLDYHPDDYAQELLDSGKSVLFRRPYAKKEVVGEALAGRPFPPKSTRHTIPDRVIRLNMPLGWLLEEKEDARRQLEEMLGKRAYSGNVRRYPEPVIVIY
ncbi:hypothetical protein JW721_03445 [Candidatus Micrarchaeota archaeon]|nr:hypothetical protein [Candidatus Micrarchaeota archaeon]